MHKNSLNNLIDITTRPDFRELVAKGGRNRKGKRNFKTVLKELLEITSKRGEWADPVAETLIIKALKENDLGAIKEILDRMEGKAQGSGTQLNFNTNITFAQIAKETFDGNGLPPGGRAELLQEESD